MRPLRRNPKGRVFPGDLLWRAARPWGLPRASRRFAHLIPESLRRGDAGLIQRFPDPRSAFAMVPRLAFAAVLALALTSCATAPPATSPAAAVAPAAPASAAENATRP